MKTSATPCATTNVNGIQALAERLEKLETRHSELLWTQYTTGLDFGVEPSARAELDFLKNPVHFEVVETALATANSPREKREADLMHRLFRQHHLSERANFLLGRIKELETTLSATLNKHRCQIDGRETAGADISKILNQDPDRARRQKAYLSRTAINQKLFDGGFLQLLDLRKEYAGQCGFESFVALKLDEYELPADLAQDWKAGCVTHAGRRREKLQELSERHLGIQNPKPWDLGYLENQICSYSNAQVDTVDFFPPMERLFQRWGFELQNLNLTFDVFPRKNKSEWGYNFTLRIGQDSRILANLSNRFAAYWVLLHETAHGVHFLGLDPKERILNRGVSGIVAEGFANFFGNLSFSSSFLTEFFPDDKSQALNAFKVVSSVRSLGMFPSIATAAFDQGLYQNDLTSLQDIEDLNWKTQKEYLGEDPYADQPVWGHLIHHTTVPIYLHNYFLGDALWAQLQAKFENDTGQLAHQVPAEFGNYQKKKLLDPSGSLPFMALVEQACGQPLSLSPFLKKCVADD